MLFLTLALVPLLLSAAIFYWQSQTTLQARLTQELNHSAKLQSDYIEEWIGERLDNLRVVAGTARVRTMDPSSIGVAVQQYFYQWGKYESMFVTGTDGHTIYSTDGKSNDYSQENYFQRAVKGSTLISEPFVSRSSGQVVVAVVTSISSEGKIVGVVGGILPIARLSEILEQSRVGETGDAYLVDSHGYFITPPRFEELLKQGKQAEEIELKFQVDTLGAQQALDGQSGVSEYVDYRGVPVLGAYRWITKAGWGLLIEQSQAEAYAMVAAIRNLIIGLVVMTVIAAGGVSIWVAGNIARPIQKMSTIARHLAAGDIHQQVDHQAKDEVGELADSFRLMICYQDEMAQAADRLAEGDLTVSVAPQSEQDALGNAFSSMVARLGATVSEVSANATRLNGASSQLAQAAYQAGQAIAQIAAAIQEVTQGSLQQAESVNQTVNTMGQMNRVISWVSQGAQEQAKAVIQASQISTQISSAIQQNVNRATQEGTRDAAEAARIARSGASTIRATIHGMETIRATVDVSAQKVRQMGQRSAQITDIVETIEDIASQTNLLALNAAIEAARAEASGTNLSTQFLQQHLLGVAQMVAEILRHISQPPSCEEVTALAKLAQVDSINISNGDGVVIVTNQAVDLGFRFPEGEKSQAAAFRVLLTNPQAVILQPITPRSYDGVPYMYVGIPRRDGPGLVQTGMAATTVARFTEAGRGFAVVAAEVRKLSERAKAATRDIATLIRDIQVTVTEAVKAMNICAGEVENGMQRANDAGAALADILATVESVNSQVEKIAAAAHTVDAVSAELINAMDAVSGVVEANTLSTREMTANSDQVTQAIESIASLAQQSQAAVEEVSASASQARIQVEAVSEAASSLAGMAHTLEEVVQRFQLASSAVPPAANPEAQQPPEPESPA